MISLLNDQLYNIDIKKDEDYELLNEIVEKKRKVIILKKCKFGGYGINYEAIEKFCDLTNIPFDDFNFNVYRNDLILAKVIFELKENAFEWESELEIYTLPVETRYRILEFDGCEYIELEHDIVWIK